MNSFKVYIDSQYLKKKNALSRPVFWKSSELYHFKMMMHLIEVLLATKIVCFYMQTKGIFYTVYIE